MKANRLRSCFFTTLHEDETPHRGLSIHRAVHPNYFCDFGIIWDEDYDDRIWWIAEQIYVAGLLPEILFMGERKASLSFFTSGPPTAALSKSLESIVERIPSDVFNVYELVALDSVADASRREKPFAPGTYDDLLGARARWRLGKKPHAFTVQPYDLPVRFAGQ